MRHTYCRAVWLKDQALELVGYALRSTSSNRAYIFDLYIGQCVVLMTVSTQSTLR